MCILRDTDMFGQIWASMVKYWERYWRSKSHDYDTLRFLGFWGFYLTKYYQNWIIGWLYNNHMGVKIWIQNIKCWERYWRSKPVDCAILGFLGFLGFFLQHSPNKLKFEPSSEYMLMTFISKFGLQWSNTERDIESQSLLTITF